MIPHGGNDGGAYVHPDALPRLLAARQAGFDMPAPVDGPRGGAAAPGGLVPSRTSLQVGDEVIVSLGQSAVAERRVARLKKSVWASGKLHALADNGKRPPVCWFVTLTYRGVDDWRADHVSSAVQAFRLWCRKHGIPCRYTWVAELQQRGAVHYHLLAWLPVGFTMPKWDKQRTPAGRLWWPHGMSERAKARSGVGYLMKYLSKLGEFHRFPKGLRLYGIGGLSSDGRSVRAWLNLPEWAKRLHGCGDLVRRAAGLVVRATGQVLTSPYRVRHVPGGLVVRLVGEVAERFHEGPYSTLRREAA